MDYKRTFVIAGNNQIATRLCQERGLNPRARTTILVTPGHTFALTGIRKRASDEVIFGHYDEYDYMRPIFEGLQIAGFSGPYEKVVEDHIVLGEN